MIQKEILLSFVRDTSRVGEYFLRICTNQQDAQDAKLVPLLDIANMEKTSDKLGLTINLESSADTSTYNENSVEQTN